MVFGDSECRRELARRHWVNPAHGCSRCACKLEKNNIQKRGWSAFFCSRSS